MTNDGLGFVEYSTLLRHVGPSISVPLLLPVTLTGLPLLLMGRSRKFASVGTTVALAIFIGLGSASIGWYYLPALTPPLPPSSIRPVAAGHSRLIPFWGKS